LELSLPTPSPVPRRGYLFVALAALLWAVSGASAKYLFTNGMTPLQLTQARVTLGGALLLLWLAFRNRSLLAISPRDLPYYAALGIAGLAMVNFTYLITISKLNVAAAVLLQYLAPVLIALHAILFLGEHLSRATLMAVVGATAGCYLVVGGYNLDLLALNREGVLWGLISAVVYAGYSLCSERGMRRYSPWTVLFYSMLFAALFWNCLHFFWKGAPPPIDLARQHYPPLQWVLISYVAVFGTLVPFGLYFMGINLIRSTRASITATLEPISAGVISFLALGETLEPLQIAGGILVIGAIILLQLRKEYDDATPELIRRQQEAGDTKRI
jgi:drug/metabolite transporter (DMT)-like permease